MSTINVAKEDVELCKNGQNRAALETLFSKDAASVEAMRRLSRESWTSPVSATT